MVGDGVLSRRHASGIISQLPMSAAFSSAPVRCAWRWMGILRSWIEAGSLRSFPRRALTRQMVMARMARSIPARSAMSIRSPVQLISGYRTARAPGRPAQKSGWARARSLSADWRRGTPSATAAYRSRISTAGRCCPRPEFWEGRAGGRSTHGLDSSSAKWSSSDFVSSGTGGAAKCWRSRLARSITLWATSPVVEPEGVKGWSGPDPPGRGKTVRLVWVLSFVAIATFATDRTLEASGSTAAARSRPFL